MEVRRTAVVKLDVSDAQRDALQATREQFRWCANHASEYCWNKYDRDACITNKREAQQALYDDLRAETGLTANLVIGAIYRAVDAVTGCVERWKKRQRVSQPEFTSWFMDYDKRSATISRCRSRRSPASRRRLIVGSPHESPTLRERTADAASEQVG